MLRGISKLRVALVLQHGYAGTLHDVALSVLFFVFQASSFNCECCFPHWFPTFLRLQWGICIGLPGWCWTVAYVLLPISSAYGFATSERCQLGVSLALSDSWFVLPFNQNVEPSAQPSDFLPPLTQSTHTKTAALKTASNAECREHSPETVWTAVWLLLMPLMGQTWVLAIEINIYMEPAVIGLWLRIPGSMKQIQQDKFWQPLSKRLSTKAILSPNWGCGLWVMIQSSENGSSKHGSLEETKCSLIFWSASMKLHWLNSDFTSLDL